MPSPNPQLLKSLESVVDKYTATQFENAKPAAKLANGLLGKISDRTQQTLQIARDCTDIAAKAVQRYIFVGPNAKDVVEAVKIQPTTPEVSSAPTQRSSGGGGH